jgi:hypothetical protein
MPCFSCGKSKSPVKKSPVRHTAILPAIGINGPTQAIKKGNLWVTLNGDKPVVFVNGVAYTPAAFKKLKEHLKATAWNFNLKK